MTGRFLLAHADYIHAGFPQAAGQTGEIAVAGHDAEPVHIVGVQNVHGVNDEGRVCGVFAYGVLKLLDGDDGVFQQFLPPAARLRAGPVAINALVGGNTILGHLVQNVGNVFVGNIVGIDQQGIFLVFQMQLLLCGTAGLARGVSAPRTRCAFLFGLKGRHRQGFLVHPEFYLIAAEGHAVHPLRVVLVAGAGVLGQHPAQASARSGGGLPADFPGPARSAHSRCCGW